MRTILFIAAMLALTPVAHAQVYKCKMPNGQTEYKDKPCSDGSREYGVYANDTVTRQEYEVAAQVYQRSKAHANQLAARNYSNIQSSSGPSVTHIGNQGSGTVRRTCR